MVSPPRPLITPGNPEFEFTGRLSVNVAVPSVTLPSGKPNTLLNVSLVLFRSSVAPPATSTPNELSTIAAPPAKRSVPTDTTVKPVYVFVLESSSTPAPDLVKPPVPLITPV